MTPENLIKQYEAALASQRWENVEPLVHRHICVTFSTGTFKGISAVQQAFEENFAIIKDEQYAISELHWIAKSEHTAICIYQFNWQGMIDGELCSGSGRGTSVMVYENQKWQIITEHLGPNSDE